MNKSITPAAASSQRERTRSENRIRATDGAPSPSDPRRARAMSGDNLVATDADDPFVAGSTSAPSPFPRSLPGSTAVSGDGLAPAGSPPFPPTKSIPRGASNRRPHAPHTTAPPRSSVRNVSTFPQPGHVRRCSIAWPPRRQDQYGAENVSRRRIVANRPTHHSGESPISYGNVIKHHNRKRA